MNTRTLFTCGAMLALLASCKDDQTSNLDESAEAVADKSEELGEKTDELAERGGGELSQRADIAHTSADLASAEIDFDQRRDAMVGQLRFLHDVYETQAAVARGMLSDLTLTETDRQAATDRILTFERELGESTEAIDALATSTAAQWDAANVTVSNAFQQLDGAHDDAFDTLSADREILR